MGLLLEHYKLVASCTKNKLAVAKTTDKLEKLQIANKKYLTDFFILGHSQRLKPTPRNQFVKWINNSQPLTGTY